MTASRASWYAHAVLRNRSSSCSGMAQENPTRRPWHQTSTATAPGGGVGGLNASASNTPVRGVVRAGGWAIVGTEHEGEALCVRLCTPSRNTPLAVDVPRWATLFIEPSTLPVPASPSPGSAHSASGREELRSVGTRAESVTVPNFAQERLLAVSC